MILELFKSKKSSPKLTTSIFNDDFVDLHSHILPGLDDGPSSREDALLILRRMKAIGIKNIVLTPHVMDEVWENTSEEIIYCFEKFQTFVQNDKELKELNLHIAAEYTLDEYFLSLLERNDILTLHENLVLVEISYKDPPMDVFEIITKIQRKGLIPVLAHPEKCLNLHPKEGILCKLKSAGCLFQLNLLSLSPNYNKEVCDFALWLLRNNMIDYVGTDIHRIENLAVIDELNTQYEWIELLKPVLNNNCQLH